MTRPDHPVLDNLEAIVRDIETHRDVLCALEQRLRDQTQAIGGISEQRDREAVAAFAYWNLPTVHANDLATATFSGPRPRKRMLELASATGPELVCDRCEVAMRIETRDELKRLAPRRVEGAEASGRSGVICYACYEAIEKERAAAAEKARQEMKALQSKLQTMSYAEYIETDHWVHRREQHFVDSRAARRAYQDQCESCKETLNLDVFHWHDSNRGCERREDLAILCAACANALLFGQRLVARPLVRRSR
jgi:hypothetical protein